MALLKSETPGPGRPSSLKPHDLIRRIVTGMAAHGITQEEAAEIIGISETTLKRRLGDDFAAGVENYDGAVVKNLRRLALGSGPGAVTACIYWTKVRLGWSEKIRIEHTFGPIIEKLTSGLLDLIHRAVPDFCPSCRTALNLKPEIGRLLLEESKKLSGEAAAVGAAVVESQNAGATGA